MNDFSNLKIWKKEELPNKGGIYLFENKINSKVYVGQSVNIHKRIIEHFNNNPELYFHQALKKYGIENFNIYILEYLDQKEEMNTREIYYINKYNSNNSDFGYNLTKGGRGHLGTECSPEQRETLSTLHKKETWGYNYETGQSYHADSREELAIKLISLGYKELSWNKIIDAIRNKSYSSCFTFGNTKEEAINNANTINPPKKFNILLYNYKTGELSEAFTYLSDAEKYIRSLGYKLSPGHLSTAIKNNNKYIKDFIFGNSEEEINKKINSYGLITYCYNLNDNSLYRFTDSIEAICKKLEGLYPEIHLCRGSVGKVKSNKQVQTIGFIFDSNLDSLIKRVSEYNSESCEKLFTLAKEFNYLNSQSIIQWQDKLNSISVDYDGQ